MTTRLALLVLLALASCRAPEAARDDLTASTDAWHAERLEKLRAPYGWLSLVHLAWLAPGSNRVGRAADAEVSYAGLPADEVGTIEVDEDGAWFEAADGVEVEGVPTDGHLATDADGAATMLTVGDVRFYVIDRGGRLAVRMKDPAAATRTAFGGVQRFPVDADWRIVADFEPAQEGTTVELETVADVVVESDVSGRVRFRHAGTDVDAALYPASDGGFYLRFGDRTNGSETYAVGRYLYVEPSADGATVVLDFNRAYNPPCAFTPFATCSFPEASNRFPFDVNAGERYTGQH